MTDPAHHGPNVSPEHVAAFQAELEANARRLGIPEDLITGAGGAEAFRAWEAPRRAAYEAARDEAIARLEPAFGQLGRLIEQLAYPPRYITIDEEHTITAEQLEQFAQSPGRIWMTSTANEVEPHRHALELLDELGALMTGLPIKTAARSNLQNLADVYNHHLDAIRRAILHHHDLEDPAGADERARARRGPSRP